MASITASTPTDNNDIVAELARTLSTLRDNNADTRLIVEHLAILTGTDIDYGEGKE